MENKCDTTINIRLHCSCKCDTSPSKNDSCVTITPSCHDFLMSTASNFKSDVIGICLLFVYAILLLLFAKTFFFLLRLDFSKIPMELMDWKIKLRNKHNEEKENNTNYKKNADL